MLAHGDGLPPESVVVGALPPWLTEEAAPAARAIAEVAVRRALYPSHPLAFVEPGHSPDRAIPWSFIHAAAAVHAGETALVLRRAGPGRDAAVAAMRLGGTAASVAAEVADATVAESLSGTALEHVRAMVAAAIETLDRLTDDGWRSIAGDQAEERTWSRGTETVAERIDTFDPFDWGPDQGR